MSCPCVRSAALILDAHGSALSFYGFISPVAAARLFGMDLERSAEIPADQVDVRFVDAFGGRNLALRLAILAFYWQRMPRAMGTTLPCAAVSGVVDTVVTGSWGPLDKA